MNTRKVKKAINKNILIAQKKGADLEKIAMKEYEKIKKEMDVAVKKVGNYIKKNPKKAAAISAGIGATLGAAITGLIVAVSKNKKK